MVLPIKSVLGTISNIKRILVLPCDTPPSIYIEAAVPAALGVFWDVETPDPREIYTEKRGHSMLCDIKMSIEDWEFIPPAEKSAATRFFFSSLKWFDLTTWYLFVADVIAEGFYAWSSQIIKMAACDAAHSFWGGHGEYYFGAIYDDGRWGTLDFAFPAWTKFYPASPASITVPYGKPYIIAASAVFTALGGVVPEPVTSRIISTTRGEVLDIQLPTKDKKGEWNKSHTFFKGVGSVYPTETITQEWSCSSGNLPTHQAFPKSSETWCFMWGLDAV